MTTKIICLLALMPGFLWAQIQWEHTYDSPKLERRMLDQSGETYLLSDNCSLALFTKNHNAWKTIQLDPTPGDVCGYYLLSEAYVDTDPELEVVYSWGLVDHHPLNGRALRDDNGQSTGLRDGLNQATFSMPPGLAPKLLSGPAVYQLPGAVLEHQYGADDFVYRMPLADGSDRYLVYNYEVDDDKFTGFHFYDGAHQWVKTVKVSPELDFVSQHSFNQDDLFEFAGEVWVSATDPNPRRLQIVQEDGTVLQNLPCTSAQLDRQPPLPDRYLVQQNTPQGEKRTLVIQPAPWELLQEFENQFVTRHALNGEEEFYLARAKNGDSLLYIMDATFSLLNKFTMPAPYRHYWKIALFRNRFSASGQLELCFTNQRQGITHVTCLDENGQLLYDFPGAKEARYDRQTGMDDRLFIHYDDSTAVYRFQDNTIDVDAPGDAEANLIYPNPFQTEFTVQLPAAARSLKLFDQSGRVLRHLEPGSDLEIKIPAADLPAGLYFLQIETDQQRQVLKICKLPF